MIGMAASGLASLGMTRYAPRPPTTRNSSRSRLVRLRSSAAAIRPCISAFPFGELADHLLARLDKALAEGDQRHLRRQAADPGPLIVDADQRDRGELDLLLRIDPLDPVAAGLIQAQQGRRHTMGQGFACGDMQGGAGPGQAQGLRIVDLDLDTEAARAGVCGGGDKMQLTVHLAAVEQLDAYRLAQLELDHFLLGDLRAD